MSPRHSAYIPPSVKLSLKLYTSIDDDRFPWLMGILYGYTTWVIFQIGKHLSYIESQTDSPFSMIKKPRMFVIIVD